ncbi:MAG: branched-chain amino acid ABC transporter permease, partial [Burkholderiales bacterium]
MRKYIIPATVAVLALVAPIVVYPIFLMQILCFAIFASAFNLVFGYAGMMSFGHAAFFGSAAYITGYVVKTYGLTPEIGIILGAAVAAVLGLIIGMIAIKRQGIYFAMITFALAEVVNFVAIEAPFTGGEDGLQNVPRGNAFGLVDLNDPFRAYYFVLAVYCIC